MQKYLLGLILINPFSMLRAQTQTDLYLRAQRAFTQADKLSVSTLGAADSYVGAINCIDSTNQEHVRKSEFKVKVSPDPVEENLVDFSFIRSHAPVYRAPLSTLASGDLGAQGGRLLLRRIANTKTYIFEFKTNYVDPEICWQANQTIVD